MTLASGTRIGPYEVRARLGSGGMGDVYVAHDARLHRDVALKTLPAAFSADAPSVARFEREARLIATLNHPNVATVHGFERDGDVLALVMELVEGETLAARLRRVDRRGSDDAPNGLPVAEAVAIARQLVAALDAAHERGIVHRDLKPANIVLTPDDVAKVLDFGLARTVDDAATPDDDTVALHPPITMLGTVVGTPAYMSPEQARGQPVDRRTDIWSFGVVLFEMLAGRVPFPGSSAADVLAAVLGAPVPWAALPGDVPAPLRRLLALCLERVPRQRLRDIADAGPYLEEAVSIAAQDPAAPSGGRGMSTAPAAPSRRAFVIGGVAIAGLAAGAGLATFFARREAGSVRDVAYQRLTFRDGLVRSARFAPDGRTVLYGALWDGDVCRVYTVRPDSPESAPLPLPPAMPLAVSADGELALAMGTHFRGVMTYGTLARVPLAGGAPREVTEDAKYADWAPDGGGLAIVRRDGNGDRLEFPVGTRIAGDGRAGFSFPRVSPRGDAVAAFMLEAPDDLVGTVAVFGRDGRSLATSPTSYYNVFGLAWRGDEVWFTAAGERPLFRNALYAMDRSGRVRTVARLPGNTTMHDFAPDGRALIARTDDRSGFAVRAPQDTAERDLSWLDASAIADLSADGTRVLFSEYGVGGGPAGSVYLRGTDGSPAVRLADGYASALSPDGRFALVNPPGHAPHLDIVPTGAGETRRLERAGFRLGRARWLADGRIVASARAGSSPPRLVVIEPEGDGVHAVTPAGLAIHPHGWSVSPAGDAVAVNTDDGPRLYSIADGSPRAMPPGAEGGHVVGWIDEGLLVAADPVADGRIDVFGPASHRRWAEITPRDPTAIMNLDLRSLVVTGDGRAYGYSWHRAKSDLYLVDGWS